MTSSAHAGVDPNYGAGAGGGFGGGFAGFDGNIDLGDIFGSFFGGGFGGGRRQANPNAPRRGADIRVSVALSFMEAAKGCKKTITVNHQDTCPECGGSGAAKGTTPETCPDCGGRGVVTTQTRTPFGVMQSQRALQPLRRAGQDHQDPPAASAPAPDGCRAASGWRSRSRPGIDDDQSLAMRGLGDKGANGGPAGDVIIIVTVRPDTLFERDKYDVWVTVPITFSQAVNGDEVVVPTIDGKVEYKVPEGTQSGTVFRLRGKGIQYLNGKGRGDQYVKVNVEIPKRLTRTQREALKKFEETLKDENYEQRKGFFKTLKEMFGGN